ncbi:protein GRAVITROPIC IN THE LIGHT 1 [Malania oleifera]|uniref:protein GRAVITROPIC IN THE LIGHT 1 n=1 Tax=Malania oleifera TaxID=397392 RepID=UPI0025AE1F72|nr:protein GRAVITROPIC IN THE LIGHT 1 [Malania oleifera]
MPEMDGSSKPPQISEMFQKFALAFKTKTFEFFADEDADPSAANAGGEDSDGFALLDSAEEFITNQKVVVIKPDSSFKPAPPTSMVEPLPNLSSPPSTAAKPQTKLSTQLTPPPSMAPKPPTKLSSPPSMTPKPPTQKRPIDAQITQTLLSSMFATISSFKASYLQLQTAHAPFDEEGMKAADRAILSHLKKLSDMKQFYRNFSDSTDLNVDSAIGSCLESQVQENQSMLRTLETVVNRLQSEIDGKHSEVLVLRQKLNKIQKSNLVLSKRLNGASNSSAEVLLSVSVFDSVLRDTCRSLNRFTKLLMGLIKRAGWDLDLAAKSVHPDIDYAKRGHIRYAFLSYVCLGMFQGFDLEGFGLGGSEIVCNGNGLSSQKNNSLKQLIEHVSVVPMEVLGRNPNCEFSKFCEKKYQQIIHPTMESSIFSNLEQNEAVLCSWRSLGVFYEAFVNMASSVWVLHKLAFSFDPAVEIFQVERGVEFSMVYMEDAARCPLPGNDRPKVGFTVVPGFRIGRTVIQSQVYLSGTKCTEL